MAEFRSLIPTNKGRDLIAKIIAGSSGVQFSKVVTSSTAYTDAQIPDLTSISNVKQSASISKVTKVNTATVKIEAALDNTNVSVGYTLASIAVYAIDPDDGEILYGVAGTSTTGYVPAYNGLTVSGIMVTVTTAVTNADNVSLTVDPAATATIADIQTVESELADLQAYVGYTEDEVYGVEIDFSNRTFTRLAGAANKTYGDDFDSILAFGGRKRCNLSDAGVVNAYHGDSGYTETGSNGQVMVEQPKFYYKVVPLKMDKNEAVEISSISFTAGASASGNITITLNGVAQNVAVTSGNTATEIATTVRNTAFAGWTTGGSGSTVSFTANKTGTRSAATFSDSGSTGVTASITLSQRGYIGKGFKLRKARYYISMSQKTGFKIHPAFVKNGAEKDKIYLSAFEGSLYDVSASAYILDDSQVADFTSSTGDKLCSIANAKPISGSSQNLTRRNCGILAENRGSGWSQQYAATVACSQLLAVIEYAGMNMQTKIGAGVTTKTDDGTSNLSEITGATTNLGNESGSVTNTNNYNVVTYRGEENIWGNIWKFTDGMNIYCDIANGVHELYIADNSFAESTNTTPYSNAGITLATKEGYISAMAYSETYDWLFVPAETTGDSALPVGDYFWHSVSSNGYKIALLGGHWYNGSKAGAFSWPVGNAPSSRLRTIGGRAVYVPV